VSAQPVQRDGGRVGGRLGAQVDRAADAVSVNVGLQSLVDFDALHQVAGDGVQLDLAHAALR
jgi:hypothetical protein